MSKRDYYEVLGVSKSASPDEIKKAYRRAAVKHHPDKEGGDEQKFKEINEAYEVLKDDNKRQRYDQFGHAGVGSGYGNASGGDPFSGFGGFGGQGVHVDLGDIGLGDIFDSFFGGGQRTRARGNARRGRDVQTTITLDFRDAVFGVDRSVKLDLLDQCEHCKGSRAEPGHELVQCKTCKGSGQQVKVHQTILGNIQQATVCSTCKGSGKVPEKECSVCNGKGTQRKRKDIKLKIPAGINDGATIRLSGYGEAIANGEKGDLYVTVKVKADKKFTREAQIILSDETISMVDAALGATIKVETVDGLSELKIPAGTQSGTDFKLSGKGVPDIKGKRRGDHIVRILVETPKKLTKKQKEILQEFKKQNKKRPFFK